MKIRKFFGHQKEDQGKHTLIFDYDSIIIRILSHLTNIVSCCTNVIISGIGIVTSFLARVIKNPSPAKKYTAIRFFYKPLTYKGTDLDQQVDRLMRFQEFLAENDKGRLFGGQSGYFEGRFFFQGTFCK